MTTEPETMRFDLPTEVNSSLQYETDSIIKHTDFQLNILVKYFPNICIETIFKKSKNSQTNEPPKFVLNLSQRVELRSSNKQAALKNVSIGKV